MYFQLLKTQSCRVETSAFRSVCLDGEKKRNNRKTKQVSFQLLDHGANSFDSTDWVPPPPPSLSPPPYMPCILKDKRAHVLKRLDGLVVKTSASRAEDPGFESPLRRDFSGSSHTSDLNIGTPVATLPGAWHYMVSTRTGRPGVSILWLGEVESWICNFYLSVAARKIVWADPSLRYTSLLLGL